MIKVEGIVTDKYRTPVINRTPLLRYFIEVHPKEIQYKDFNIEVEFDEYINTKIGNTVIYSVRQSSVIKNNSTNYGTYAVLYFIGGLVFLIILLITFIQ